MRRHAAVFAARAGGKCGRLLHEFAEEQDRLILFFPDEHSSAETRFTSGSSFGAVPQGLPRLAQRFNAGNRADHEGESR